MQLLVFISFGGIEGQMGRKVAVKMEQIVSYILTDDYIDPLCGKAI